MKLLGIDPGVRGGLAIIELNDGAARQLVDAIDIPVVGSGAKERVDVIAIRAWLAAHEPQHALIERAQAMSKQGASSVALQLFPAAHALLARKKDHGRTEAALIALAGPRQ